MTPNPGWQPEETIGKRVVVVLADGTRTNPDKNGPGYPRGWAADGRGGCRWTLTGNPFDIAAYEVLG